MSYFVGKTEMRMHDPANAKIANEVETAIQKPQAEPERKKRAKSQPQAAQLVASDGVH